MYTAGSLTKPPTLLRDEYPQWKIRMVNFLEGMDRDLFRSVNIGPHTPMVLVPRVPATADTAEIPAYYEKKTTNFTDEETNMMDNDSKAVRLLIMAIPNDIFQELDSCKTAKEIWDQLLNQLEGGLQTQKNRRNLCINEYHDFHALSEEKLHQTYSRFNILINKCRKFGVIRTKEENNVLFLKSLNEEWSQLSMSIQANQDLESWSLTDIYGTLVAHEKEVMKQKSKTSMGGPLALVSKQTSKENNCEESQKCLETKRRSKKVLIAEETHTDSDSDEDISAFAKSLALITHQFNKKFGKKVFEGRRENEERRNPERRFQQEPRFTPYSDQKGANFNHENATPQTRQQQPFQPKYPQPQRYFKPQEQKPETSTTTLPPNQNDGRCFRCGKSGHFSANCRGKLVKDQDYYKNKYKYNVKERVLVAEMKDWLSDSTSDGEEEPTNLCGMAFSDGNQTDEASEDNSEKVNSLYTSDSDPEIDAFKLINELQDLKQKFVEEKEKREQVTKELIFYKREKNLLESEKKEIFLEKTKLEETNKQKEKSFSEERKEIEKVLKGKEEEVKKSEYERLNSIALTKFFQKEREILHQSLDRQNLQIKSYVNAQSVFDKIKTQMDSQGLGFNELNSFNGLEKTSLSSTFCIGKVQSSEDPSLNNFKRMKTSEGSKARALNFKNTKYSEVKDMKESVLQIKEETSEVHFTKPQSYDSKEIFRFDAFISRESETFEPSTSDTSTSENESQSLLNPNVPLYSPKSDENIRTTFKNDVQKICEENVMEELKRKESMKRIIKVSRSKVIKKPIEIAISIKSKRDFLDSDSESDLEIDEQIFCKPGNVIHKTIETVGSGILNVPISVLKTKTRIPINPDFENMCLQAKTSLELEKELQEKAKNKTNTSGSYTYKTIKFSPEQKGKWIKVNHVDPICAVSSKEKKMFLNKKKQLEKKTAFQTKRKEVVRDKCNIPSASFRRSQNVTNAFNKKKNFASSSSCSINCNCIYLLMKLKNHFKGSHCLLNKSLENISETKSQKKTRKGKTSNDEMPKSNTIPPKSNIKGPIMRWVPKKQ
ncbi:hypothetical protein L6452_03170 [Arctium lappa]|uniref:Uncharacterized protein n=1 Tax=Arctium lappa TaxID=4217 RepID=A0ACB9FM01_ARCLA|nr:hypothetical protein L6452_03170 [Arctium lappa]